MSHTRTTPNQHSRCAVTSAEGPQTAVVGLCGRSRVLWRRASELAARRMNGRRIASSRPAHQLPPHTCSTPLTHDAGTRLSSATAASAGSRGTQEVRRPEWHAALRRLAWRSLRRQCWYRCFRPRAAARDLQRPLGKCMILLVLNVFVLLSTDASRSRYPKASAEETIATSSTPTGSRS